MATLKDNAASKAYDAACSALVTRVNERLEVLYGQLNNSSLPDFGSDMLLCSTDHIVATTVAHRFLKKFQRPDMTVQKALHQKCVSDWLEQESGFHSFKWSGVSLCSKSVLYRARELISSWTADFRRSHEISFTPGETFVSAQGRVSVYQKLRNRDAWTVTHDAFEDFARLVYNTRWLKKVAKSHFHALSRQQFDRMYVAFKDAPHVGFAVFKHRLEHEVVTLVYGGRFESVYKNNTTRRPIIVGPTGNMLLQRTVAFPLRDILRSVGNDLELGQSIHRTRISDPGVSTVDFSNASDSNLLSVITELFPSRVHRLLRRYRDPMVLIDGRYHLPLKLSSMGCGFTFEVMTMLLLAIARVLDPCATVYGDDVIISNDSADRFKEVMSELMWKVNNKKSFCHSRFRESCGAFYCDGYGYITCFDFRWNENFNDALITINKLRLVSDSNVPLIGNLFRTAYEDLIRHVPALSVGPLPRVFNNPDLGYAVCDNAGRIQRRSATAKQLWSRTQDRAREICERFCLVSHDACIVLRPKFVNTEASRTTRHIKGSPARTAFYLYNSLVSKDSIRFQGEWRSALYLVTQDICVPINITKCEVDKWNAMCVDAYHRLITAYVLLSVDCGSFGLWCLYTKALLRRKRATT